jgi:DNA-binding protein H-NS
MTIEQILNLKGSQTKKATKPVAARYQHPENPEQQWSGRGRQPRWVKEYLEKPGKTLESLLIS